MSDTPRAATGGDGRKVVSGIGWNFVAIISEQLSTLVAFVVIARVLGPEDFGVVALAVVVIDILIVLVRGGVSESLIRVDDLTPQLLGTGFWLNMAIGCVLMLAIFVLAPSICAVLDVPQAVPLMRTMSVVFPIAAAGAVAEAVLSRRMAFGLIARRQIVGSTCGAAASIVLALTGFGLWAMIVQRLVIFIVGASLSIMAARFVPPMRFSGKAAGQIARYGSGITSTNMMYRLQPRAAELVIGILAQPLQVALYRAAYRIVDLVNQLPMQPIMRVTFPTLSRLLDTPDRFRAVLLRFTEGLQIMLLPIYAGIGYFSADIFHVLFGSKWDDAVPAFVLLLVASALRVTFAFLGPASAVRGAVKATASFAACDVGISIALMVVAAPWGIEAIAASRIVGAALLWPIAYVLMMKPANLAFGDVMKTLRIPLSISIALLVVLFALDEVLAQFGLKLNVLVGIPICAVVYLTLVALLSRSHLSELLTTMGLANSPRWARLARKLRIIE